MAAKIILHEQMSEKEFFLCAKKWDRYPSVVIYFKDMDIESRKFIFEIAINNIPNYFSEAVIDNFLEDENFFIDDGNLMKCIKYGSYGLKRSIFYRKSTPEHIRALCDGEMKNNNT
ncbi:hypothetical protein PMPD1_0648 [Paramixta manurensis]|uniref:Uncharacterized protein n=1 Tax=Paramixta manurensis TaxID=2740817 RepID=A0A6M8UD99_9GAMM|nr:hypothetical protein PMPD1_0648 [Erwiniaceae bacterium PD-1]